MNKYYEFLTQNAAFSAFCGSIMGATFMWLIASPLEDDLIRYGTYGISALIALFASGVAWISAMANIHNQKEQANREEERSLLAARSALSPVLSRLYSRAEKGVSISFQQKTLRALPTVARDKLKELTLSTEELSALTNCIKYSDSDTARWLSLVIAHFQIETSRLEQSLFTNGLIKLDQQVVSDVLNWAINQALVGHLFEFVRTGKTPPTQLDKTKIKIPMSLRTKKLISEKWDEVYNSKCKHLEETGGWGSSAFQDRLLNPESET